MAKFDHERVMRASHLFRLSKCVERRGIGPSIGEIWLQLGRQAFPRRGWTDFVFVLLSWWVHSFRQVIAGSGPERVSFMEGPHEVELMRASAGWLHLIARERRIARRVTRARCRIPTRRVAHELLRAVEFAVEAGRAAGDRSREFRWLEREVAVLRLEARSVRPDRRALVNAREPKGAPDEVR